MISIGQHRLGTTRAHLFDRERFNCGLSANGNEGGSVDRPMGGGNDSTASARMVAMAVAFYGKAPLFAVHWRESTGRKSAKATILAGLER